MPSKVAMRKGQTNAVLMRSRVCREKAYDSP